jgi:hypothetical protein
MQTCEITVFTKANGPLTKRISLAPDGTIKSDGSACVMANGTAERASISEVSGLAKLIEKLGNDQAITLGALRAGLRKKVKVVTARQLNGRARPNIIARTGANIIYEEGPAFALLDFDTKGMPAAVGARLKQLGGFWAALLSVLPALADVARVTRRSTSSGIFRGDTGEQLPGSDGVHVYPVVQDATDIERFLKTLHNRCWLAGLGWMMVSKSGALLERSIIDRMVYGPERLVFEGGPVLVPPLKQDKDSRRPIAIEGDVLETVAACPPLTLVEQSRLEALKVRERHRLAPEVARIRPKFIAQQAERLVKRGVSMQAAKQTATRWCDGVLLPSVELPFDDEDLAGCTVADVLADPDRFVDQTLADPLEGVEYGVCKAKVMRRADGSVWVHSFAHGRTVYELMLDAASVRQAMEQAAPEEVVKVFTRLTVNADLDAEELAELRRLAKELSGVNLKAIDGVLKAAQQKHAEQQIKARREHSDATRRDPRPLIPAPLHDAPWQPEMDTLNEVLGGVSETKPPSRDIDGITTCGRKHLVPELHAFTEANAEEELKP